MFRKSLSLAAQKDAGLDPPTARARSIIRQKHPATQKPAPELIILRRIARTEKRVTHSSDLHGCVRLEALA